MYIYIAICIDYVMPQVLYQVYNHQARGRGDYKPVLHKWTNYNTEPFKNRIEPRIIKIHCKKMKAYVGIATHPLQLVMISIVAVH